MRHFPVYELYFFDFDGVIIDSVNIKTQAFAKLFEKYGQGVVEKVIKYHEINCGVSRFDKFEYYYKHLLKKEISIAEQKELSVQFSKIVFDKLCASEEILGATGFLRQIRSRDGKAFLVSASPIEELKKILSYKKLDKYFVEVFGAPQKKDEIICQIISAQNVLVSDCVMFGDAENDYMSAKKNGIDFIAINPMNIEYFQRMRIPIFNNFKEYMDDIIK